MPRPIDAELLRAIADEVLNSADWEATNYEAQIAVEGWTMEALEAVLTGNPDRARHLLTTYAGTEWEESRSKWNTDEAPDLNTDTRKD